MDKRSLLIGFGIGIIVGAILLELFNLGASRQQLLDQMEREINPPITENLLPEIEQDSDKSDQNEQSSNKEEDVSEQTEQDNSLTELQETSEPAEAAAEVAEAEEVKQKYILRIEPGKTISKTAAILEEYNIIADRHSFIQLLTKENLDIRAGYFLVEENSSNEQLKEIVIGTPLTEAIWKRYIEEDGLEIILSR